MNLEDVGDEDEESFEFTAIIHENLSNEGKRHNFETKVENSEIENSKNSYNFFQRKKKQEMKIQFLNHT